MSQIHCVLFNLGDPNDMKAYEDLLNREANEEIYIMETDKTWGNKAEGVLFVYITFKDREEF